MENKIKFIKIIKKITYFAIFFDKKLRKKTIFNLNSKIISLLQQKYSNQYQNDYIIFSRNGAGDIFFAASLLEEFKKTHPGKIVYITDKPNMKNFIESFSGVDEVIADEDTALFQGLSTVQKTLQKGQINFLFFPYRGTKPNYVFADSYANLLGLSPAVPRTLPRISNENKSNAHEEFQKLSLNAQKTVILIPESVMFDYRILSCEFWKTLAKNLQKAGFDVVINSKNKTYKNFKTTFLPINDFIEFSKSVKHVISFRSGICDVLAGCGIKNITAIYPPNLELIWADKFIFDNMLNKYHQRLFETEFENIFHIYSLNSNFKTNENKEIIFDYNENKLQKEILKDLTSNKKETKIKEWI